MNITSNSTPLNTDKFKKNLMTIESASRKGSSSFSITKYDVILGISILCFVAGLSFWVFVNYMI